MDERQQQIRERVGLEEARINQDFVEFLQRWSFPILIIFGAVAGGYALYNYYQKSQATKISAAFADLEAARSSQNVSPDSLLSVAESHEGVGVVAILARLDAADAYLDATHKGVVPGAQIGPDGAVTNMEDLLNASKREELLGKAATQYQWVVDNTSADGSKAVHTMGGLYGLAAVAESRGDNAGAKSYYERIKTLAEANGFKPHVALAEHRIKTLDTLTVAVELPSQASVPTPLDTTPKPPTETSITGPGASLVPGAIQPVPAPVTPPAGEPVPPPAPAPAPTPAPK